MCFKATVPQLQAMSRDDSIKELVSSLAEAEAVEGGKSAQIARAVIQREQEASTGLGKGIAVPHVKHKAVKRMVGVVGISASGIDFASLDERPVYTVILLLSPTEDPDKHLQAMERIFNQLQRERFRKFLAQCSTAEEIENLFVESDENPGLL